MDCNRCFARIIRLKDKLVWELGIGKRSSVAYDLVWWAVMESDLRKAKRIINVAKRIEQRYRLAHGLPNMGV